MSTQTESIEIAGLPLGTRDAIEELSRSEGKSAQEYLRTLIETEVSSSRHSQDNELQIKQEFESWEAASDEDWLKFEDKLTEVE
jgi:hypothetical protein